MKIPSDSQLEAKRPSDALLAAYHDAGHTIAARLVGNGSLRSEDRRADAILVDWLTVTAAGHAAERELVRRLGLSRRDVTLHAGHDLDSCYRRICDQTGEEPGDWILLHWIRAVRGATRLLTGRWSDVESLAELNCRREAGRSSLSAFVRRTVRAGNPRSGTTGASLSDNAVTHPNGRGRPTSPGRCGDCSAVGGRLALRSPVHQAKRRPLLQSP